jgi:hypothetical protein
MHKTLAPFQGPRGLAPDHLLQAFFKSAKAADNTTINNSQLPDRLPSTHPMYIHQ